MTNESSALPLAGREVLLIVGGGIAAYKSALLARELLRRGASVEVVLTEAAKRFVGGVTFAGLTGKPAREDLWDASFAGELHVALTERADAIVVAPATADLMARAATGQGDDLATVCLLCAKGPVIFAPAMHTRMWEHAGTRANVASLRARGAHVVGPADGPLASGASGLGRMSDPEAIADGVCEALRPPVRDLEGVRVLVTAGPTYEAIDPVRFVGNRSSGKMGVAVVERALARGATVTLVHGPISAKVPEGATRVRINSARELREAVLPRAEAGACDVVVMAAAVADYRPADVAQEKIKKGQDEVLLRMVRNPDILSELGARRAEQGAKKPVLVGFAVETGDLVGYARGKLSRKGCDMVVANLAEHGFEGDDNVVTLVTSNEATELGRRSKRDVAEAILDRALALHQRASESSRQGSEPSPAERSS